MNFPTSVTVISLIKLSVIFYATRALMLIKVTFTSDADHITMERIVEEESEEIDVWQLNAKEMEAAVPDHLVVEMKSYFNLTILNPNLYSTVNRTLEANKAAAMKAKRFRSLHTPPIKYYAPLKDIYNYMKRIKMRLGSFATLRIIGKSYEGRDIKLMRFGIGDETKPAVFIMSGLHSREWLAIGNGVYFLHTMANGIMRKRVRIMNLLKTYDFYIVPVVNPDGYVYTMTTDRLWRKTRSKVKRLWATQKCYGVDPNRNFDVFFKPAEVGCDEYTCLFTYRGPFPFSENCTRSIRDFALSSTMKNRIKLFFDLHSYAQQIFYPYAYNSSVMPPDHDELVRVAKLLQEAIKRVNGREFETGPPGILRYNASGTSMDWFKSVVGVKYVYAIESYPSTQSNGGFLVDPEALLPSGKETTEGILAAASNIKI